MSTSVRIFRYISDDDAFLVTDEYHKIADAIGLSEWHPAVWIGRLFILDNDLGEHWFDNWDIRANGACPTNTSLSTRASSKTVETGHATHRNFANDSGPMF